MSQFHIINESTEDTLASTDSLEEAIVVAREAASQGQVGALISILESGGKAVKQFLLMPDGAPAEQAIACQAKYGLSAPSKTAGVETEPYQAAPGTSILGQEGIA